MLNIVQRCKGEGYSNETCFVQSNDHLTDEKHKTDGLFLSFGSLSGARCRYGLGGFTLAQQLNFRWQQKL